MTRLETKYYPESRFGGFTACDSTVAFYTRVNALAAAGPARVVVDFGCGRGVYAEDAIPFRRQLRDLRGAGRTVIGMDVDSRAASNPFVDEFRMAEPGGKWPAEDDSADLVIADFVVEHLEDPDRFLAEAARVLKRGGHVAIRTPNSAGYVVWISRIVPGKLHRTVLRRAQPDREEEDVFPAVYHCNSAPRLRRALAGHGFDAVAYGHGAEPSYLGFSRWIYRLGVTYHRHAPLSLAPVLFAFGRLER